LADPELLPELTATVDVLLSNPPYVPERIRAELATEIAYDPAEAVFAGPDGLSLLPALLDTAARLLRPGGLLVIEHDESHAAELTARFTAAWHGVRGHRDLTGRARFTSALRT